MRITNQILARTAAKSGIPLQQTTLLDIMNRDSSSGDLLSSLNRMSQGNTALQSLRSKESEKLEKAAESLSDSAARLAEEGEDSLFAKAEKSGDTSEIVSEAQKLAEYYNQTVGYLGNTDSVLNSFYQKELQSYISENADALRAVGITVKADGKLRVDEAALKEAGLDSLRAAFGAGSGLTVKVGYVSGRVAENAAAMDASILNGYTAEGLSSFDSFELGKYNFWG